MKTKEDLNYLGGVILDSAITVHKEMGPGLLESVYHECLWEELVSREVCLQSNVPVPLIYKGKTLKKDYIIDLLVEDEIVIELKAIDGVLPVHQAQIISYLKLACKRLGYLINFNVPMLKHGFTRYVNGF